MPPRGMVPTIPQCVTHVPGSGVTYLPGLYPLWLLPQSAGEGRDGDFPQCTVIVQCSLIRSMHSFPVNPCPSTVASSPSSHSHARQLPSIVISSEAEKSKSVVKGNRSAPEHVSAPWRQARAPLGITTAASSDFWSLLPSVGEEPVLYKAEGLRRGRSRERRTCLTNSHQLSFRAKPRNLRASSREIAALRNTSPHPDTMRARR